MSVYKQVYAKTHPNANTQGRVYEHVYVASQALGKKIPSGVHVHHVNRDPKDNRNSNLVICTGSYHRLIHARSDAYDATGDANKMKCAYCKEYDDPENMYVRPHQYQAWHTECRSKSRRVTNPKTGPYKYGKT